MAVPKQKHTESRTRKRRSQWKTKDSTCVSKCTETGHVHKKQRACEVDGVLYFKGKILPKNR